MKGPGPELFEAKVHKIKVSHQARFRPLFIVKEKGEFHRAQTRDGLKAGEQWMETKDGPNRTKGGREERQ